MTPRNSDWKLDKHEGGLTLCVPMWLKRQLFTESRERNMTVNEVCRRTLVIGMMRKLDSDFTVSVRQLEGEAQELL